MAEDMIFSDIVSYFLLQYNLDPSIIDLSNVELYKKLVQDVGYSRIVKLLIYSIRQIHDDYSFENIFGAMKHYFLNDDTMYDIYYNFI